MDGINAKYELVAVFLGIIPCLIIYIDMALFCHHRREIKIEFLFVLEKLMENVLNYFQIILVI